MTTAERKQLRDLRAEVRRLKKVEHIVWHALDDGEDRLHTSEKCFVVTLNRADFRLLNRLLPEEHPR